MLHLAADKCRLSPMLYLFPISSAAAASVPSWFSLLVGCNRLLIVSWRREGGGAHSRDNAYGSQSSPHISPLLRLHPDATDQEWRWALSSVFIFPPSLMCTVSLSGWKLKFVRHQGSRSAISFIFSSLTDCYISKCLKCIKIKSRDAVVAYHNAIENVSIFVLQLKLPWGFSMNT